MGLGTFSVPDRVIEVYPYLGDLRGRFRLGDLVELTDLPASTCHKVLQRMERYGIVTKQSTRSRIWIKKFDTVSEWLQNHLLAEVREMEKRGEVRAKPIEREERPL